MNVKNFIVIFAFSHPRAGGYIRLENGRDIEQAKQYCDHAFENYAIYREEDFTDEGYYPKGCLETVNLRQWHDYVA